MRKPTSQDVREKRKSLANKIAPAKRSRLDIETHSVQVETDNRRLKRRIEQLERELRKYTDHE